MKKEKKKMPAETTKEKLKIAELKIGRGNGGIKIHIISPAIEEFMKAAYGGETAAIMTAKWGRGESYYRMPTGGTHPTLTATRYIPSIENMEQELLTINDDHINVSFLRVEGISKGKEFVFPGLFREMDIAAIAETMNEVIKNLFREYSMPTEYTISISGEGK